MISEMFERLTPNRFHCSSELGKTGLYDLTTEALEDPGFIKLTDDELSLLDTQAALNYGANIFRTLPEEVQDPIGRQPSAPLLMSLSEIDLAKYGEVVRIMSAKELPMILLHQRPWQS